MERPMSENTAGAIPELATGMDELSRSLGVLALSARNLGLSTADMLEREMAMAIAISNQVRYAAISEQMLRRVREEGLPAKLRRDAHEIVDLVADIGFSVAVSVDDLLRGFVLSQRPPLAPRPDSMLVRTRVAGPEPSA